MGLFTSFQLKSRDASTRRRAALELAVPGKASAIGSLEPLLGDAEWPVRQAAAEALGAIGGERVAPLLLEAIRQADLVSDPGGAAAVRDAAVAGLARAGAPLVPALLGALHDRHARVREGAIAALGQIGGDESVKALREALGDDRSNVRQAAAPALAHAAGRAAIAPLRDLLSHRDPATRRSAADALGATGHGEAAGAVAPALADRDRSVREAAVQSLGRLGSPEAIDALCGAFAEGDRELKGLAASGLRSLDWSPAGARQRAVHAVLHGRYAEAAAEGPAALEPLVALAADREPAARRGAAEALGGLPDPRGITALVALLADQDAGVREAAVSALARIGEEAAFPLVRALDDRGGPSRAAAGRAVEALGFARVAAAVMAPLEAGARTQHGGVELRVVGSGDALDEARRGADHLEILLAQAGPRLPVESLRAAATLDDVILIEPGRKPDLDDRLSCEALREGARSALAARGLRAETGLR